MRKNAIAKTIAGGGTVLNGWLAIASPFSAEVMAHQGFDAVTIDLQHGPVDFQAAVGMLQAISTTAAVPMVRVPWNEPILTAKLLDAGAYGIICPMINSKAEAEALVNFCRYPPRGTRSFGPNRAALYGGADYWQHANDEVLIFAMVETRQAVNNVEEIISVEGLNGIYVGPSDLSLSMGKTPTLDPQDSEVLAAIKTICTVTRKSGKIAGVHTDGAKTAIRRFGEGYQLCTLLSDARLMANAAAAEVREARGQMAPGGAKTY
ncbi:MAG: HpcH/HpaI aldolase family protein [Xanthobacteraceae bacterium]